MNNLQTVSMIAAFPIGFIILLILASFIKDARRQLRDTAHGPAQGQTNFTDNTI
jgi:BCCT family betaine/carnitine transporter